LLRHVHFAQLGAVVELVQIDFRSSLIR
jgi:hypothetical protein